MVRTYSLSVAIDISQTEVVSLGQIELLANMLQEKFTFVAWLKQHLNSIEFGSDLHIFQ